MVSRQHTAEDIPPKSDLLGSPSWLPHYIPKGLSVTPLVTASKQYEKLSAPPGGRPVIRSAHQTASRARVAVSRRLSAKEVNPGLPLDVYILNWTA